MVKTKPRTPDEVWIPQANIKERPPWTVGISIFKDYKCDNKRLLTRCFEFDYQCSRIKKIVKDDSIEKKFKILLRSYYKWIKAGYKYYSTAG